jgi:ribosome-associated translation inhibitor RaiA
MLMTTSRKASVASLKSEPRRSAAKAAPIPPALDEDTDEVRTDGVEIHFQGLEKSAALVDKIEAKIAKLRRHFGRLAACRVVLDAPNRGPAKLKTLKVKIEMSVPKRKPLVVEHERTVAHAHNDINLALRDAFIIATRRIDEAAERIGARVRQERGRRRPAPVLA